MTTTRGTAPIESTPDPWNIYGGGSRHGVDAGRSAKEAARRETNPFAALAGGPLDRPPRFGRSSLYRGDMNRIGQILVGAGAITAEVRDRVLAHQQQHQVSFGTAILELGLLSEELLLRALSVQASAPPAHRRDLASIPADVIALVPAKLVEQVGAVPFKRTNRVLHVAMAQPERDPGNGRIAAFSRLDVVAHVAIAGRVAVAAEKYYGISTSPHLRQLVESLDRAAEGAEACLDTGRERSDSLRIRRALLGDVAPASSAATTALHAKRLSSSDREPVPASPPADLFERLASASDREEISMAVFEALAHSFGPVVRLDILGDRVAVGAGRPPRDFEIGSWFPLADLSLLAAPPGPDGAYVGPCPDTPVDRRLLETVGCRFPGLIGVAPVLSRGPTKYYLLGQVLSQETSAPRRRLGRIAEAMGTACEILSLKRQLRMSC